MDTVRVISLLLSLFISGMAVGISLCSTAHAIEPEPTYGTAIATGVVVPYPRPTELRMIEAKCPDYEEESACAGGDGTIYVPKGWGPYTFHHEEGHEFDFQKLLDVHRRKIMNLMGVPDTGNVENDWWGDVDPALTSSYDPPGEWFAEAYSNCTMQATGRMMIGAFDWGPRGYATAAHGHSYSYKVSARIHRRICQVIWHADGMKYKLRPRLPIGWRGTDIISG